MFSRFFFEVVLVLGLKSTKTLLEHLCLHDDSGKFFCGATEKLLKLTFEWSLCVFLFFVLFFEQQALWSSLFCYILLLTILLNIKLCYILQGTFCN